MNAKHLLFPVLFGCLCAVTEPSHAQAYNSKPISQQNLYFVENKGQVTDQNGKHRSEINFRVGGSGLSLFAGSGQLHYQWTAPTSTQLGDENVQRIAMYRMDVTLIGADPQAQVVAEQQQPFFEQYYLPHLGLQGATAHAYQKVTYKEIYPNIDWVLYVRGNSIEYDFVVRPGGKVSDIRLQYGGATSLSIDKKGLLTAVTPMGKVTENKPVSFQADGTSVASSFVLQNDVLSFSTAPYSGTLTIDPTLSWATYFGGAIEETTKSGCVTGDVFGNGYLCGYTNSTTNIATTGSYKDTLTGGTDAFLVKFNNAGVRKWATYYGGTSADQGWSTATDPSGNVYLSGFTNSNGLSTTGSHQAAKAGGNDAFLVKFDTSGVRQWATYYGGSSSEQGNAVSCDKSGNVYLGGFTNNSASGIATTGAYQTTGGGGNDAFLVKFNSAGVRQWGTYYGGSGTDQGMSLKCDTAKNVFLAGYSLSTTGLASTGGYQSTNGGNEDGFLVKFDSSGVRQWGTFYGGSGTDMCQGVTCDPNGNAYIVGYTLSTSGIATTGSYQPTFGGGTSVADAYLVKFNSSGTRQWATYYGSTGDDWGLGISADVLGHIYITGFTNSTTGIATAGAIKDTLDFQDAFVVKFDTTGARIWGTYFGGEDSELGYGIFCNSFSNVFIGGMAGSLTNLATSSAHQTTKGGGYYDGYMAMINDCNLSAPSSIIGSDTVCHNAPYTYTATPVAGATSYTWILPSGWAGTSTTNTISLTTGSNSDTIRIMANFLCGTSVQTKKAVIISSYPALTPSGTVGICNGDSVTLVATAGITYQWLNGTTTITGATAQNYTTHNAGFYAAIVTNTHGCTDTSLVDTVVVHPLPVPVITATGVVLSTGTFSSYQWKHNGTAITGAISSSYTITLMSGLYSVTVTDANGCEGTSVAFDAGTVGIDETNGDHSAVSIYPNPVTDILYFRSNKTISAAISTMDGRVIGQYEKVQSINMSNYAAGVYLLRITDSEGRLLGTEKIVKHTNR
ncbi:DUF7948 domain-containing protein [Taibaiella soli]|uniref:Uncharacterized protein n=1 Tax=Taibaiella soli TaxID=1649169 RepID=A0A2W2A8A6_9BACT|nr:SBBP repeat-containing protein [Taibaiella soli]PZF71585.1 hypothetical protein DN068_16045 [Taibaiella soli]